MIRECHARPLAKTSNYYELSPTLLDPTIELLLRHRMDLSLESRTMASIPFGANHDSRQTSIKGYHAIRPTQPLQSWFETGQQSRNNRSFSLLPCISQCRRDESLREPPLDTTELLRLRKDATSRKETVLYLAYGSNLSIETFRGKRGITPLTQVNVVVPSLVMTFDLPGLPYKEPCFANTRYHTPDPSETPDEKAGLLRSDHLHQADYHKDRWHKGLVGVVYEVTKADYAHIIATEGGGSGYNDIVVDCWALPSGTKTVPVVPTGTPFKVHTLFAPAIGGDSTSHRTGGRLSRPDPSYAQASARYLKLITDGADELHLPLEYRTYLHGLRSYQITSARQQLGQYIFLAMWTPIVAVLFAVSQVAADKDGRFPSWLALLFNTTFTSVWLSYDLLFKNLFGDGERTRRDGNSLAKDTYGSLKSHNKGDDGLV